MNTFALVTALHLCSSCLLSVSGSGSQIVEVQSGDEVTLLCSNFSSSPSQIFWFRAVKRSLPRCISHMFQSFTPAKVCDGFENGKFEMTTNISTVFLKIKQVNSSDSGLYFCGYQISYDPVIAEATYLDVQEGFDRIANLPSVILGALAVFFIIVSICLAAKIRKLQKAHAEEQNTHQAQGSDDVNYASVTFHSNTKRSYQPASEREVWPSTIYSATR